MTNPEVRLERRKTAMDILFNQMRAIYDTTEMTEIQEVLGLDENEALEVLAEMGTATVIVTWEDDV